MASSVSSERAFSSAGITISKRRNRLKADIVEALQCLKSIYHHKILFRELPSSLSEDDAGDLGDVESDSPYPSQLEAEQAAAGERNDEPGWDNYVEDLDDEDEIAMLTDDDDLYLEPL